MNDFLRIDKGTKERDLTLKINKNFFIKSIFAVLFFSSMSYLSFENYLLFHGIIEILCILVALMIFTIVANTNGFYKNAAISIVGVSFGVVAMIDGLHTLAYKGMGVFVGYGADLPTQMWIISRYVNSISIFLALILFRKNLKYKNVVVGYGLVCIFLFINIFKLNIFPSCFVEGIGLTPFKIYSEYAICIIYLVNMFILYRKKPETNGVIFKYLQAYLIFSIIAELCFTLYIDVYGLSNVIGHHFKLLAFYCIYKSLVEVNIKAPYTALQQSENRYRMFFETSPNGILLYCKDKILLTNPCFLKMFNYSIDSEVIGKSLLKFIHPDEIGRLKVLNEALKSQEVVEGYETKFLKEDGTEIYAELSIMPYNCEMGECVFIMIKDITAQKLSEKLKEEVEQKTLFNNLQRDFFTNLSHELKTPINLIFSTVQLMESKVKNDIVNIKEMGFNKHSHVLKQNCYRMLKLISNLIDITKIDTGFLKLNLKNADIISIVEDITLSTAEYIESKGISLVFDTDIEERIMATDANMIERIILNLLSNAIKFTDSGGEITVGIMDKETSIIISVKDTGVGIPKEKLDEIFGRFNQVEQTLSRNARGSGIGLALVHSLVKMHGGIIFAVSEPGKGSEFIIELPVRLVAKEDGEAFIDIQGKERYVDMMNIEFSDIYS